MKLTCRETRNWRGNFTESLFVKREDLEKVNLVYVSDYGIETFVDNTYSFPMDVEAVLFTDKQMYQGSMTERSEPDWYRNVDFGMKVERFSGGNRQLLDECANPSDTNKKKRISNLFDKYYYDNEWCLIRPDHFSGFEPDDPAVTLLSINGEHEAAILMVRKNDLDKVRFVKTIESALEPEVRYIYSIDKEVDVLRLCSNETTGVIVEKHFRYKLPYEPDIDEVKPGFDKARTKYLAEGWVVLSPDLVREKEA